MEIIIRFPREKKFYLLIQFSQIGFTIAEKCPSKFALQIQRASRPSNFFSKFQSWRFLRKQISFFFSVFLRSLLFSNCQLAMFVNLFDRVDQKPLSKTSVRIQQVYTELRNSVANLIS